MVSVIVPVYNAENFLEEAIESVINQTYTAIEVLLIDDGSTDGSLDICNEYAQKDSRVRVFHKKNEGVSSARNVGITEARGEWILFVDSDDYIRKDMIEILLKHSDGMDRVVCGYKWILRDGRYKDCFLAEKACYDTDSLRFRENFDLIYKVAMYTVWNGIYRKESIEHFFNEELLCDEDPLFNLDYMTSFKKMCIIPDILYFYRIDTENSLTKKIQSDIPEHVECIYEYLKILLGDSFSKQKNTILSSIVGRMYVWMEFIVRTDKIPFIAKKYMIENAISKDYFKESNIPIELYDEKYRLLWNYAEKGQLEEVIKLLA